MQLVLKKSDDDRSEKRQNKCRPHILLIGNPVHGTVADDKVAHDAAAESRDENDDENAYRIDFLAFDGKKAGKSKGNDPDGIGKSQETGLHRTQFILRLDVMVLPMFLTGMRTRFW